MALGRDEATQIVRFCLAGDGWGTCVYEGDAPILKLVLTGTDRVEARRFEGASFEDVLAQAVDAGVLKATCVSKQIAFLGRGSRLGAAPGPDRDAYAGSQPVNRTALFPEATAVLSALVHETQRERGISALYAASRGRLFADELAAQWRATDRRHEALAAFREAHADRMAAAAAQQLAKAGSLLGAVTAARSRVEDLEQRPTEIVQTYTHLNRELLLVIDRLVTHVVEPPQRPTALAWMALLYAKEKTGIERAQLASAFERDRYVEDQYQTVLGAIAGRQSYLHLFSAAAPAAASDLLQAKLASQATTAVEEMEQIAVAHRKGGFGVDSTAWFAAITGQIDSFTDVEAALRASLAPLAAR